MVIIIRCNDIVSDPRAMKYVKFLQEERIDYFLIGWDREGTNPSLQNAIYWNKHAGYNVGGFKAVKNRLGWMKFVYCSLKKIQTNGAILHGCDLDCAFPAVLYKTTHHSCKVIFDVFDWFSATLYKQKNYILRAFKLMERFSIKHSDYIIICEPERIEQIPFKVPREKVHILPNIPSFNDTTFLKLDNKYSFNNSLLTISYVGGFVRERCLDEIINLAEKGIVNLSIAGYGYSDLVERLENDKGCPNIKYYGKVEYQDGLNISYNSDVMYAMYATSNPNHVYAAPNKFYEAMFLGKPIFTTRGTIVERKVLDKQIGFISGEKEDEIEDVIHNISRNDIITKGIRAKEYWNNQYHNFTMLFLSSEYLQMISQ